MPQIGKGRKRLAMVRIANERSLRVTFSKRHVSIFNKARELCTLCDVEMAVLILSPTNKPYSFGDPSVDEIVNRFFGRDPDPAPNPNVAKLMKELRKDRIAELNTKLANRVDQLDALKRTGKELKKIRKENQENFWWGAPLENLGREELEHLKVAMLQLKETAEKQAERLKEEETNRTPMFPTPGSSWLWI